MELSMTLDAEFGRSDGRAHHLRFKDFDPTKNADEIKASLSKLTKLSIFDKNDVSLFDEVRHASVIEKREREIFNDKKTAKKKDPVVSEAETVQPEQITQVHEPVNHIENIRIPEDLNITNDYPRPGWLIQTIELPMGINSWDISEAHAFMLLNACLPARTTLENLEADDKSVPAKLIVTAKVEEDEPKIEIVAAANKESPPAEPNKKRKRLRDRVRKRE